MIIICPSCEKKFQIEDKLIPREGRLLQCGSCNNEWFFKKEKIEPTKSKTGEPIKKPQITENLDINERTTKDKINYETTSTEKKLKSSKKLSFSFAKFLSYILVAIISFIALIILIDTFKSPLYIIFPNLEFILFNFYEILKDIELFFRDLVKL